MTEISRGEAAGLSTREKVEVALSEAGKPIVCCRVWASVDSMSLRGQYGFSSEEGLMDFLRGVVAAREPGFRVVGVSHEQSWISVPEPVHEELSLFRTFIAWERENRKMDRWVLVLVDVFEHLLDVTEGKTPLRVCPLVKLIVATLHERLALYTRFLWDRVRQKVR